MRRVSRHGQARRYHHTDIGVNGRIDTLQAAILLGKWPNFPLEVEARRRIGAAYTSKLQEAGVTSTPKLAASSTSVYAQYTVQVEQRAEVQSISNPRAFQQLCTTQLCFANNQPCAVSTAFAGVGAIHLLLSLPVSV